MGPVQPQTTALGCGTGLARGRGPQVEGRALAGLLPLHLALGPGGRAGGSAEVCLAAQVDDEAPPPLTRWAGLTALQDPRLSRAQPEPPQRHRLVSGTNWSLPVGSLQRAVLAPPWHRGSGGWTGGRDA